MIRFSVYLAAIIAIVSLLLRKKELYVVSVPFLFGFGAHAYAFRNLNPLIRTEFALVRYWALLFLLSNLVITILVAVSYKSSKTTWKKIILATLAIFFVVWQTVDLVPRNWSGADGIWTAWNNAQHVREARENGQAVVVKAGPDMWQELGPKVVLWYMSIYGKETDLALEMKSGCDPVVFDKATGQIMRFSDLKRKNLPVADYRRYLVVMERNGNSNTNVVNNYVEVFL